MPPHEIHNDTTQFSVARIVQLFGQNSSLPYLQCLQQRSQSANIQILSTGLIHSHHRRLVVILSLFPHLYLQKVRTSILRCHPYNVLEKYLSQLDDIDLDMSSSFNWAPATEVSSELRCMSMFTSPLHIALRTYFADPIPIHLPHRAK